MAQITYSARAVLMVSDKTEQEYQAIIAVVASIERACAIDEIHTRLDITIARRTLQRRLAELVRHGQLLATGEKRSRRYSVAKNQPTVDIATDDNVYIPISTAAQIIKDHAEQPQAKRQAASYQRAFLYDYKPNQTTYLPESVRQHLHSLNQFRQETHPAGTFIRDVYHRVLVDLSWNSSRLEGNTYSLLETEKLIDQGQVAENKDQMEAKMILNHKAAIEFLIENIQSVGFNRYTMLNLHALLSDALLANPDASGRLRHIAVGIGASVYEPPDTPQLIDECFNQILRTAAAISDPFEQSFFIMVHLPYLQPFEDVNKRTSRLAANIPLMLNNLSPISFVEVPQRAYIDGIIGVYELNDTRLLQDVYVWAYERSAYRYGLVRNTLVAPDPFRLKYHELVSAVIRQIISEQLTQEPAFALIRTWAAEQSIPHEDSLRLVEMAETELVKLHEGNIARHKISLSDFEAWHRKWELSKD